MKQFSPKNQASSVLLDLYLIVSVLLIQVKLFTWLSFSHGCDSISLGNHAWEKRMGGELRTWEPFDQGGTCVFFLKQNFSVKIRGGVGFMKHLEMFFLLIVLVLERSLRSCFFG